MSGLLIFGLVFYILGLPIILRLMAYMQRRIVVDGQSKRDQKKKFKRDEEDKKKPIWPKWKKALRFAFRDNRSLRLRKKGAPATGALQNRFVTFGLWGIGLILAILSTMSEFNWALFASSILLFFIAVIFAISSSRSIIKERKRVLDRLFAIGSDKMRLPKKHSLNPEVVVQVAEWRDFVKPAKIRFDIPTTFGQEGQEGFMKQLNQVFGTETAWVPSYDEKAGERGWDYDGGRLYLRSVPPLPQMAKWDERYVLSEAIAWSFFPIALGVENGVELVNEETGETENVLGFDLSGEQVKTGKKAGVKVSQTITTSPMVFIGGGTGGGKAESVDTPVLVLKEEYRHLV